jgi:predicted SprT family Zn-dependent metalloprotease
MKNLYHFSTFQTVFLTFKVPVLLLLFCFFFRQIHAQPTPQKTIDTAYIQTNFNDSLLVNKTMDTTFQTSIKAALMYYPELKNRKIKFRIRHVKSPLAARPTFWAIFQKPENRTYLITISRKTSERFEPILLKNLSFNAQIGVLGHELSHIAFYNQQKGGYFIRLVFMQLNSKAMDTFENDTDKRCIAHGLGYQLLSWSSEVREKLKIKTWRGVDEKTQRERERYMSPASILKQINY